MKSQQQFITRQWWSSPDRHMLLNSVSYPNTTRRKLILLGVAVCQQIKSRLDVESIDHLTALETFADTLFSDHTTRTIKLSSFEHCPNSAINWLYNIAKTPTPALFYIFKCMDLILDRARNILQGGRQRLTSNQDFCCRMYQANLIREVFHCPFTLLTFDTSCLSWNDSCITKMAKCIYEDKAFDQLPILADALEDAGCDSAELLHHLRIKSQHVRGCWALDCVLQKHS